VKIKPIFKWYDIWIGFYYDRENKTLYFFPIPMLGLKIEFKAKKNQKIGCHERFFNENKLSTCEELLSVQPVNKEMKN
jgi:hypothetical protein